MSTSGFDEEEFRCEVAEFLRANWNVSRDARPEIGPFLRRAVEAGYIYRNVPREYGGSGQKPNPIKALIIKEEFSKVGAPREPRHNISGVNLLVPTLLEAGEDWQKDMFIPKTLTGEYIWAQGYSEPDAGSDLAAVRTKGELVGNEWVINGQKVWTSVAQHATHMFMLVRTEPKAPKREGISYLLVDIRDKPGVTIKPLIDISGAWHFNEVFFDDVRTPSTWIVGKRGEGWLVSRKTLVHERTTIGSSDRSEALFASLLKLARNTMVNGRPAIGDPVIREELAKLQGMVSAHRAATLDQVNLLRRNEEPPPATPGFMKFYNSTITDRIARLAQKILGESALASPDPDAPGAPRWVKQYMNSIAAQIGGGTTNMQRNQIAERALGLPRDDS